MRSSGNRTHGIRPHQAGKVARSPVAPDILLTALYDPTSRRLGVTLRRPKAPGMAAVSDRVGPFELDPYAWIDGLLRDLLDIRNQTATLLATLLDRFPLPFRVYASHRRDLAALRGDGRRLDHRWRAAGRHRPFARGLRAGTALSAWMALRSGGGGPTHRGLLPTRRGVVWTAGRS